MTNNVKTDILVLLTINDLSVDQLLKRLNYYPSRLVIEAINELVDESIIKFNNIKLTVNK